MSTIKFVQGDVANLPSTAESEAIYFTRDNLIYLGLTNGSYHQYGNYIPVDYVANLPTSALDGVLYYVKDNNALYKYDTVNSQWVQITVDTSKSYDITSSGDGSITITETDSEGVTLSVKTVKIADVVSINSQIASATTKAAAAQTTANEATATANEAQTTAISATASASAAQTSANSAQTTASEAKTLAQNANEKIDGLGDLAAQNEVTEDFVSDDLLAKINNAGHEHSNLTELEKISEGDVDRWNANDPSITYEIAKGSADGYVRLIGRDEDNTIISDQEVQIVTIDEDTGVNVTVDEAKAIVWDTF